MQMFSRALPISLLALALLSFQTANAQITFSGDITFTPANGGPSVPLTRMPSGTLRGGIREPKPLETVHDKRTCEECKEIEIDKRNNPVWTSTLIGKKEHRRKSWDCSKERTINRINSYNRSSSSRGKQSIASVTQELNRQIQSKPRANEMIRLVPKGTNAYVRNYMNFAGDPEPIRPEALHAQAGKLQDHHPVLQAPGAKDTKTP